MNQRYEALEQTLAAKVEDLWTKVSWDTRREEADRLRRDAIQACHAFHRTANPAYRERCEREDFLGKLELEQLPATAFPEEIYKAYSQKTRGNGNALGVFCERDVPLLLEHLNHYLVHPITSEGLAESYILFTNIRGGLDRLIDDMLSAQEVLLVTSSGTTGSAFSLIPFDKRSFATLVRMFGYAFEEISRVPGYGPIESDRHCLISNSPRKGAMMQAVAFAKHAESFGERAFLTIPASVGTRELRWRAGAYAGASGALLRTLMKPVLELGGKRTSRGMFEGWIEALRAAEELGVRTAIFGNPWMAYNTLRRTEALLQSEIEQGLKQPGDRFVDLAPGSVLIYGGGNKSGLDVPEAEITAMFHRLIGGLERVVDVWTQAESYGTAIRCADGNYHLDPHVEYFTIDSYVAYYDPRQANRVPAIVTGDIVGSIVEEPCPCGAPTRYFQSVQRDDENRGSRGCAAALAEYA